MNAEIQVPEFVPDVVERMQIEGIMRHVDRDWADPRDLESLFRALQRRKKSRTFNATPKAAELAKMIADWVTDRDIRSLIRHMWRAHEINHQLALDKEDADERARLPALNAARKEVWHELDALRSEAATLRWKLETAEEALLEADLARGEAVRKRYLAENQAYRFKHQADRAASALFKLQAPKMFEVVSPRRPWWRRWWFF